MDQYTAGVPEALLSHVSPETWLLDWERMSRPGNFDMQFEMSCTSKSNIEIFPAFQEYFRTHQPPALVIWGKYDPHYSLNEALCYKSDLPHAHIHIVDGSHVVLETSFDEVSNLIDNYLSLNRVFSSQNSTLPKVIFAFRRNNRSTWNE